MLLSKKQTIMKQKNEIEAYQKIYIYLVVFLILIGPEKIMARISARPLRVLKEN